MKRAELHGELLGLADSLDESVDLRDVLAALGKLAGQLIVGGLSEPHYPPMVRPDPVDVRTAKNQLWAAQERLDSVRKLPIAIGARVKWSNGVVWTRRTENGWESSIDDGLGFRSSDHIATLSTWEVLT